MKMSTIPTNSISLDTQENKTHSSREENRHYVGSSEKEMQQMLQSIRLSELKDLFDNIPDAALMPEVDMSLPSEASSEAVLSALEAIAAKNNSGVSFIGDGLPVYRTQPIVETVCQINNLATAYTPYQPERSQGTLMSHWIYQCLMSALTGFEAINTSLYDRSTAIYEGICYALRMKPEAKKVVLSAGLYSQDIEVVRTLAAETGVEFEILPISNYTGVMNPESLFDLLERQEGKIAAFVFPQVNHLGLLENVNRLTDIASDFNVCSIAVVDPMLLATGALKQPSAFGAKGADVVVGEGQHLAIGPNFGGPGLGVFGVRYNEEHRNEVRNTPGRFVGKAKDIDGNDCYTMVLSTREQHIRKEKATSNICSNQAFLATLAGAAILGRGEFGMSSACMAGKDKAYHLAKRLAAIEGITLPFPQTAFFNEFVVMLPESSKKAIKKALKHGLHIGVDVSDRIVGCEDKLLKISLTDVQTDADCEKLMQFFVENYGQETKSVYVPMIPPSYMRFGRVGIPQLSTEHIKDYYTRLGYLNMSPKDACYPLGSCTMKYNPLLNEKAANIPGFVNSHPQLATEESQGSLEVLFHIQEWFKKITGLDAVTTQPVAGAQGELVALKLFQAYHREYSEKPRDIILIPKSAHGTNFATAAMAGYKIENIIGVNSDSETGLLDVRHLDTLLQQYGERVAAIMITNPNTSGIFETSFIAIAKKVHEVGGLVFMDGANLNAICGWVNLKALGVDAMHSNLHKTWSIPHGGGGPGDAIVAVDRKLEDYLPGYQIVEKAGAFKPIKARKSIGSIHRNWGNFAHKVRCLAYLMSLGREGIRAISANAVLSSRYLFEKLSKDFAVLPTDASMPRMHEFILTLTDAEFEHIENNGVSRSMILAGMGKLFLDFGFHAPTISFPEANGIMIEPTETYSKDELDRFAKAVVWIKKLVMDCPKILIRAPYFMPIGKVDEVGANRNIVLSESLRMLPQIPQLRMTLAQLSAMPIEQIYQKLLAQVK